MDRPLDDDSAQVTAFETSLGWMAIAWTERGLARFTLGHPSAQAALTATGGTAVAADQATEEVCDLVDRLQAYAAGDEIALRDICHRLAGNAGLFGFAELSAGARRAEEALLESAEPDARAAAIEELLALLAALPEAPETPPD